MHNAVVQIWKKRTTRIYKLDYKNNGLQFFY